MKKTIFFITILTSFYSCKNEIPQDFIDIDITSFKSREVPLSEIADSVEYIPLETKDCNLLAGDLSESVYLWDKYILIRRTRHYYLFNRQGKFLRQISSQGRGPGQFPSFTTKNIFFYSQDSSLSLNYTDHNRIDRFDLNGHYKNSIDYGKYKVEYKGQEISSAALLHDSIWVIHAINRQGNDPVRLLFFNFKGHFITKIVNTDFWEGINRKTIKTGATNESNVDFYQNNEQQLFFREERGDTIFEITSDMKLKPHIAFSFHDGSTYAQRRSGIEKHNIWRIIKETDNVLIFLYRYPTHLPLALGIYYKKEKKGYRLKEAGPLYKGQTMLGFTDDLAGGINVSGYKDFYQNNAQNNCIIDYKTINIIRSRLTPEYLAKVYYRDTLAHNKLIQILDTLKEDDNPVVIITHLKK